MLKRPQGGPLGSSEIRFCKRPFTTVCAGERGGKKKRSCTHTCRTWKWSCTYCCTCNCRLRVQLVPFTATQAIPLVFWWNSASTGTPLVAESWPRRLDTIYMACTRTIFTLQQTITVTTECFCSVSTGHENTWNKLWSDWIPTVEWAHLHILLQDCDHGGHQLVLQIGFPSRWDMVTDLVHKMDFEWPSTATGNALRIINPFSRDRLCHVWLSRVDLLFCCHSH